MYYRKYFAGSVENVSLTRTTVDISSNTNRTEYYVVDDVICRAIKETLEDSGIACTYTSDNSTLVIDGLTVQILRYANSLYYNMNGLVPLIINATSLTTYPFSGNNYKFYVTIKGDSDSVLNISVGSYNAPNAEYGLSIGKGKDLKDDQEIRAVNSLTNSMNNSLFYIIKGNQIFQEYKNAITFGYALTSVTQLNGNGTDVTLIECVAQPGRFKLNNCYFGITYLTNNEFYNIGGDIYYKLSNNILVKCVNG